MLKIFAPTTQRKDRERSIKKQLQCNNKSSLHGVFKGRLKFFELL